MNLTQHFTLEELVFSQTAAREGIDNTPDDEVLGNLFNLAVFLEQCRSKLNKPIFVSSGYRSPELNKRIGGSPTSSHMYGRAADITSSYGTPKEIARALTGLDYDQLIVEFDRWVHVSIATHPRKEILTAKYSAHGTVYESGLT